MLEMCWLSICICVCWVFWAWCLSHASSVSLCLFYDLIPFMYWSHLTDLQCVLVQSCEYVWTPSTAHPSRNPSQGSQFFLYCSLRGIWLSGCFECPSASNRNVFKLCFFYNPRCPEGFHTRFVFEEQNLFMSCTRWAPF